MAIHRFIAALESEATIAVYGDGTQTRDFTYISDVIEALVLAGKAEFCGETFNVGGGTQISVNELIAKIEHITQKDAHVERFANQKGDVKNTQADISKAEDLLGWTPHTPIDEGLEAYARWCSERRRR